MDRSNSIVSSSSSKSDASAGPIGLDRSNSVSSSASGGSSSPFAYQTRLLERTSSRSVAGGSFSRTNSLSHTNSISNASSNGLAGAPASARRWTPSHRVGSSLDTVRGKWEERARAEAALDNHRSPSPPREIPPPPPPKSPVIKNWSTSSEHLPYIPQSKDVNDVGPPRRSLASLKRHTLPTHIMATPLSPNNTGITVEGDEYLPSPSFTTPTPQRIRLPPSTPLQSSSTPIMKSRGGNAIPPSSESVQSYPSVQSRSHRFNMVDIPTPSWRENSKSTDPSPLSSNASSHPSRAIYTPASSSNPDTPVQPRSASTYAPLYSLPPPPENHNPPSLDSGVPDHVLNHPYVSPIPPSPGSTSVMSPTPYKSSYMSNKSRKASAYGDSLSSGRRLGKHLPRIASGDADDDWVEERKEDTDRRRRHETREKERRARVGNQPEVAPTPPPKSLHKQDNIAPGVSDTDDVAGIPGRLRLSRDKMPSAPASPLPSAQLGRGLWADTQRHHLQAYEYLCHVGEAQQWIEGCLGEQLEFGVVEMEEGLRNGVVLAKLVRAFRGEKVVRKIYEVRMKNHITNV
jgi:Ras GTPase-activating-like protein IQGAP2/3